MATTKLPTLGARRYYTRFIASTWWVAGPILSIVLVCASLAAVVAAYYAKGVDERQPVRFYTGAESDVITPMWATRVMVWAEFPTTPEERADQVALLNYVELSSYFAGSFADGSPWTLERADDLQSYVRWEGSQMILGFPLGASPLGGDRAAMAPELTADAAQLVPSGYALGFQNDSVFDTTPLVFILTALAGVVLFGWTMTPQRNHVERAIERSANASRDDARAAKREAKLRFERAARAGAMRSYERELSEWHRRNYGALRQGIDPGGKPTSPYSSSPGDGAFAALMVVLVLAGPLWGLGVAVIAGIQALNAQVASNSFLTVLLPLAGDTPWRVFVMATTAFLIVTLPPVLGVIMSWRINRPGLRTVAIVSTLVLLAVMVWFVIVGTTLPIDRAIQ